MNISPVNTSTLYPPPLRKVLHVGILRVLVILVALLICTILSMELITNSQGFIAYTLLLLGYLATEIRHLRRKDPYLFWINPVVLASLVTFILAFGITNLLYFMPEKLTEFVGLQPTVTPWMNQLMLLVLIGACAMWIGYSSAVGSTIGLFMQQSRLLQRWILSSEHINQPAIFACLFITLVARLWSINLGVYGYSASYDSLIAGVGFSEYLFTADLLGKFVLMVVAVNYYSVSKPTFSDKQLLLLVLGYQVIFGFISGMKGGVVFPFIILAIASYCQKNLFPRWLIPVVVIAVIAAYAVIEPFRISRHENPGFTGTSIESIVSTMIDVDSISRYERSGRAPVWLSVLARNNLTYIASLGIEYAAKNELPDDSPQFVSNMFLAPAHALVPRLLWTGKPIQQDGLWYTRRVVGSDIYTSTAMSPFTYLNFAGGPLAVILGFLFVGIMQRSFFDGLRGFGAGGIVVYLGLLSTLAFIDSSFNSVIVGIIRFFPMLVVAQYVLLQHPGRAWDSAAPSIHSNEYQ